MIFIDKDKKLTPDIAEGLVEMAARAALAHQGADPEADLTIVLTDDSRLQVLNRDYLGMDAPTDVLSFPSDESDPQTNVRYLGDILISVPRAAQQAAAAGHPAEAEVQLLVVHGVLHLMGHDHAESDEKARMWAAQEQILAQLGLGHIQVQEE